MTLKHGVAIVVADGDEYPRIDVATADFTYVRTMRTHEGPKLGLTPAELSKLAKRAAGWAQRGDLFLYFISGEKALNPGAAQAMIANMSKRS